MKLYNTLSRKIEEFVPINSPYVGLYACGVTVYDYVHLGHLRKYTMDDVLIRVLRHAGYQVEFVQNITDVGHLASDADTGEDKLEKGAKKYGQTVWDIAKKFEDYFFYSMDLMNNLRPDVSCRATEHIKEQLQMVLELEKKGFTYEIKGDGIYFDTSKLPDYGKLARLKLDQQKEGVRVETKGKRNPSDFALWKFERENENRAMSWPSPWAEKSFPGWHIECSAMAMKYLGNQFDIHTGGIDHIPVHHTNEIAQSEAAYDVALARYWLHSAFLTIENRKISKSAGDYLYLSAIAKRGIDPLALRYLFLQAHYRSPLSFSWESLEAAASALTKLRRLSQQIRDEAEDGPAESDTSRRMVALLRDDLATPSALALLWEAVRDEELEREEQLGVLVAAEAVLGLGLLASSAKAVPQHILALVAEREAARAARDFTKADALRIHIETSGYRVEDGPSGPVVTGTGGC